MLRHIDAQALEAGVARLRPGIVDPDIPIESCLHFADHTLIPARSSHSQFYTVIGCSNQSTRLREG